ncbi:hypothetical protein HKD21_14170 [Gluconobacter cerevisiae]|uniref:Uncharacterized protein n=1 Tax=Gluconobacter cerevisiae TaxID=1379734 RepID=A0ABR9YHM3_9PROT|nr:plasmid recombination protein [Gluconobacter cerevisiae]MBF0877966.1 hypothetical protein [Gluconobacter cerevisiae]
MSEGIFSAVRCFNVKSIQSLASAREHAFRRDENSQKRVDLSRTDMSLASSEYAPDNPRDVVQAFKGFKERTGIKEQKGASVALHMLCVVSPEWLAETGDPRDPQNPRVRELFRESQKWAEEKFGPGSVIASRMDMDEAGSGVVDVFVCPSSVVRQKGRDDRHVISTRKALKTIQREYKKKRSFMALQDSFAEYCQANLDPKIQRGIPKETTQREHVHADIYRPAQEQAREILRDAEDQKTQIYENAKTEAIEDFECSSWVNRVAVSAKAKEKKQYEKGKGEGKSETAKKANRSIGTWKEQNTRQKETIKKLREERNELRESLKSEKSKSAEASEPLRQLRRENEALKTGIERTFERMDMSGIDINPYLDDIKTVDQALKLISRDIKKMIQGMENNKNTLSR